ncbi:phosphomannomutase/phosphoglucomutase [Patescibacteria group bacterium]|nr:phosphomannomutase/phosphoglucomutase [Patescibacteria group bacterium]
MMKEIDTSIFKAYDIRGIAGENLSEEIMEGIGKAYGTFVKRNGGKIIVTGRDIRHSSLSFHQALNKGLLSTGCDVWDMGLTTTPSMYFSCHKYPVDAGVVVTASHNPSSHNGLKMYFEKMSLPTKDIMRVRDILLSGEFEEGEGIYKNHPVVTQDHIQAIVDKINLDRPLKLVADLSGAMGIVIVPELIKKIGCEVEIINGEVDPDYKAHQPDPIVLENYPPLINKIKEVKADMGFMYDGDADRIGFVDNQGQIWLGDKIQMLLARDILPKNPGSKVIVELKNSEAVVEEVLRLGGEPIFWKTGHTLIEEKLHEENAILAAEMSCHYYIADQWYKFDDAMYAMARVIQIVANSGQSFAELMGELPNYPATPEYRVTVPEEKKLEIVEEVVNYAKEKCDRYLDIDGIRGYIHNGWFLVRSSNTQPMISVRAEAKTSDDLEKVKDFIKSKLDGIDGVNLDWSKQHS